MATDFEKIGCVADDRGFQREAYDMATEAMERFCFRGSDFQERLHTAFAHIYLKGAQSGFDTANALHRKTEHQQS